MSDLRCASSVIEGSLLCAVVFEGRVEPSEELQDKCLLEIDLCLSATFHCKAEIEPYTADLVAVRIELFELSHNGEYADIVVSAVVENFEYGLRKADAVEVNNHRHGMFLATYRPYWPQA